MSLQGAGLQRLHEQPPVLSVSLTMHRPHVPDGKQRPQVDGTTAQRFFVGEQHSTPPRVTDDASCMGAVPPHLEYRTELACLRQRIMLIEMHGEIERIQSARGQ